MLGEKGQLLTQLVASVLAIIFNMESLLVYAGYTEVFVVVISLAAHRAVCV